MVEEVDLPELQGEAKIIQMLEEHSADRAEMRRELSTVKKDVAEMKEIGHTRDLLAWASSFWWGSFRFRGRSAEGGEKTEVEREKTANGRHQQCS